MTKARTAAEKRRNKRQQATRPISLPGGETATPRPGQGHREAKRPADEVAINARIRQEGIGLLSRSEIRKFSAAIKRALRIEDSYDKDRVLEQIVGQVKAKMAAAAKREMSGCAVGRRLMQEDLLDRDTLWQAVKHMRRVWLAYDRAIGAPQRHAQCLRIMTPPDAMHADASSPAPDLRSPEERDRAAVSAWMALQGWLDHTDRAARTACIRHVVDEPDQPITDWSGIVLALRCVAEGVAGRQVSARIRRVA